MPRKRLAYSPRSKTLTSHLPPALATTQISCQRSTGAQLPRTLKYPQSIKRVARFQGKNKKLHTNAESKRGWQTSLGVSREWHLEIRKLFGANR